MRRLTPNYLVTGKIKHFPATWRKTRVVTPVPLIFQIGLAGPEVPVRRRPSGLREFAVIHRQKCQLRSEQKLGRKAEALPHVRFWKGLPSRKRYPFNDNPPFSGHP